jgi:superfamily II DNA or RNA helicase
MLIRYYLWQSFIYKIILIVPTINLVHQMVSDFKDYGWDTEEFVHLIYAGQVKDTAKPLIISTWQSIDDMPGEFYNFDMIMVDEAHHAQAKSIKGIMESSSDTYLRFGCTGTLNEIPTHRLVLEGLFGEVFQATTTKQLMDDNFISKLLIKTIVLKYDTAVAKANCRLEYAEEIDFLSQHAKRNLFIRNLALSLDGNVLVLYRLINHGDILYNLIGQQREHRQVYHIHGGVEGEERERIRHIIESETNAILVGSYGTVSTGINIPSLSNIIFASPYKSKIRVLQSIGRGLRLSDTKQLCTILDISDDLSYKKKKNTTLRHMMERVKLYASEEFNYKMYRVDIVE